MPIHSKWLKIDNTQKEIKPSNQNKKQPKEEAISKIKSKSRKYFQDPINTN